MKRRDVFGAHVGSEIDGNGRMIDSATLFSSVVIVFDCIVKVCFLYACSLLHQELKFAIFAPRINAR